MAFLPRLVKDGFHKVATVAIVSLSQGLSELFERNSVLTTLSPVLGTINSLSPQNFSTSLNLVASTFF